MGQNSETPNKNKTGETITGTMSGYGVSIPTSGYDDEDRLVTYNRTDGNLDQSWSLSSVGDWDSITTEGTAQARTHGDSHQLAAVAGNSVSSDVKGNMTLIPSAARPTSSSLALEWDMDNRMSSADVDNNSTADVTYQFDAFGCRVARTADSTTTIYVQSGQQTIADYPSGTASSTPTYRYVYGSYIDEPVLRYQPAGSQSVYYHRNQQYSVTALTNASGAILERYAYSAYGTPTVTNASGTVLTTSAENNRYTYTGREWDDEISLYHYRARMYDPLLGRFCSKDPIGYRGTDQNLYRYVGNAPLSYVDFLGLLAQKPGVEDDDGIDTVEDLEGWIGDIFSPPDWTDDSPVGTPFKPGDVIGGGRIPIDIMIDFLREAGQDGKPCNRLFRRWLGGSVCGAATCSKEWCKNFYNLTETSATAFNDCLDSLYERDKSGWAWYLKDRIRKALLEAGQKLEDNCRKAAKESPCCKKARRIPDAKCPIVEKDGKKRQPCLAIRRMCDRRHRYGGPGYF